MPKTLTIAFRGLLVFNQLNITGQNKLFEIGILPEKPTPDSMGNGSDEVSHIPRILTIRNGVLESTRLLQGAIDNHPGVWRLVVDQPASQGGVTTRQTGGAGDVIDRLTTPDPKDDFRLVINLANREFPYGKITGRPIDPAMGTQLDFSQFKVVVRVDSGEFYTKLPSNLLNRQQQPDGMISAFGVIAGVLACDIQLNGAGATLVGPGTAAPIFDFKYDPNVIYEFSNSPPDIAEHQGTGTHFMHYYQLFHPAVTKFDFLNQGGGPGPNPALCGAAYIGETDEPLM